MAKGEGTETEVELGVILAGENGLDDLVSDTGKDVLNGFRGLTARIGEGSSAQD